jgi:hypothetical protein
MRILIPCILLLFVPALVIAEPPGDGEVFRYTHFSVRFPGKPKDHSQKVKSDLGALKLVTATFALADGSVFIASFTEYPPEAIKPDVRGTLFDGVVKGLAGRDGKVVSEKSVEIGAEKGREVVIDKGKLQMRYRMVVKENR